MNRTLLCCLSVLCVNTFCFGQLFTSKMLIESTSDRPYNIATGLIDGDLLPDIIIANYNETSSEIKWYRNEGNGSFTPQPSISNSLLGIGGLKLVDLDGDDINDIILTGYLSDSVAWFSNDGSGVFTFEANLSTTVSGAAGIAIADLDNNLTPDVAVTANTGNEIVWFSNNGSGTFTYGGILDNTIVAPGSINFQDIDGDLDLDAVVTDSNFNLCQVNILRSTFTQDGIVNSYTKDNPAVATNKYYLFNANFADVDGDANLDILATDVSYSSNPAGAYWYEWNGASYDEKQFSTTIANPSVMQFRDVDEDGLKDIILSNGQAEAVENGNTDLVWFKNSGTGNDIPTRFGGENIIDTTQSQVFVYSLTDFDDDGDLDIASLSYNQDQLNWFDNLFYNTLGTSESAFSGTKIFPNPTTDELNFRGISKEFEVSVYDIIGKQVLKTTLSYDQNLDVSQLNNGVYILKLEDQNKTFKFVKE